MTNQDILDRLLGLGGELYVYGGVLRYMYITPFTEEPQDDLYSTRCADEAEIKREFPGITTSEHWTDNDSTGFDIILPLDKANV